jgi:hypothetical protein
MRFILFLAALLALAGCNSDWLNWRVPTRGVEIDPAEQMCHETPHAFGGSPTLSCVEV